MAVTATYNDLDSEGPAADQSHVDVVPGRFGDWCPVLALSTYTPASSGSHRAEASYTKTDGSKKTASATITVRADPAANNVDPAFPTGSDRRSVDENSPPGTRVGSAVTATDPGDVLTYTLADGGDNDSYKINPGTGQITVGGPGPRWIARPPGDPFTHTVSVTATDPAGGTATQEVTITINDVNEDPVITTGDTKASVA